MEVPILWLALRRLPVRCEQVTCYLTVACHTDSPTTPGGGHLIQHTRAFFLTATHKNENPHATSLKHLITGVLRILFRFIRFVPNGGTRNLEISSKIPRVSSSPTSPSSLPHLFSPHRLLLDPRKGLPAARKATINPSAPHPAAAFRFRRLIPFSAFCAQSATPLLT